MRIDWAAEVLTSAGLSVVEEDGWKTRGAAFSAQPLGVIMHHDASAAGTTPKSPSVVIHGRKGLAGPLSQWYLNREGVWHVVASGRANHAGPGSYNGIGTGNSSFVGVEAANNGTGEEWPQAQLVSYFTGVAAILNRLGAPSLMAIGHKEWAPTRKIDPSFNMDSARLFIRIAMGEWTIKYPHVVQRRSSVCHGTAVRWIRAQLTRLGMGVGPGDVFDVETEKAVRKFRKLMGLGDDGTVDEKVWNALGITTGIT